MNPAMYAIGAVGRDTGIGRAALRIWEWRCGFATPMRNDKGERVYSAEQIRRLQRIRRVLDQGLRPGKMVPLDDEALDKLADTLPEAPLSPRDIDPAHAKLIALASSGGISALTAAPEQALAWDGLRSFVLDTFAPLTKEFQGQRVSGTDHEYVQISTPWDRWRLHMTSGPVMMTPKTIMRELTPKTLRHRPRDFVPNRAQSPRTGGKPGTPSYFGGLVPRAHLVSYTPSRFFNRPSASSIINASSPPICSSLMNIWG